MKALPSILALLVLSISFRASAEHERLSVSNLRQICTPSDNRSGEACGYYILGVTDGVAASIGDKTQFCVPGGVPLITLESLIEKAIEEDLMLYPADRDLSAVGLVTAAVQKAYPCRRSN
jgi:Rap1a immunity proteins